MIPFRVEFAAGIPLYEQVVFAAKRALVSGQMRPGDAFPSVRAMAAEFKINPNTAHKVIAALLEEGLLEVRPGLGTVVADRPRATAAGRAQLLNREIEQLVVEAKRLHLSLEDVAAALERQWQKLEWPANSRRSR